jgi:autotransporter passenger strand-loop-strand repeat protein
MAGITISSGITSSGLGLTKSEHLTVLSGGAIVDTRIVGQTVVNHGGSATSTFVHPSGSVRVDGTASRTVVSDFGLLIVDVDGVADDTTLRSGSVVSDTGSMSGGVVVGGAALYVTNGGVLREFTLESGAGVQLFQDGPGSAYNTVVDSGRLFLASGSIASATIVKGGPGVLVSAGGSAFVTYLRSGGNLQVSSGGYAEGARISSGGHETVLSSGSSVGDHIFGGGTEIVSDGGAVSGTAIGSGGILSWNKLGTASDISIHLGAEIVFAATSAQAIVSAGSLFIEGGDGTVMASATLANGGAGLTFISSGTAGQTVFTATHGGSAEGFAHALAAFHSAPSTMPRMQRNPSISVFGAVVAAGHTPRG